MDVFAHLVKAQRVQQYVILSAFTAFTVDVISTLPEEISLIWLASWKLGKVLFLAARYLYFVSVGTAIWLNVGSSSVSICTRMFLASSIVQTINVLLAEAILFLRVYALSERSLAFGIPLAILFVGDQASTITINAQFLASVKFSSSPVPNLVGCLPVKAETSKLSIVFAISLGNQLIIFFLTLYFGYSKHRHSKTPFVTIFYRDGLIYFAVLSAVLIANIICEQVASVGYQFVLVIPQTTATILLSTRMVLHMRLISRKNRSVGTDAGEIDMPLSTMEYATQAQGETSHTYN